MTQTGIINRREFDRFTFQDTFILEAENFQGISTSSSLNMSRKGAHLVSQTPLEVGSIVSIEVPSKKIQLMGEVCWVRPEKDSGHYGIGVAFHELFPATGVKLSELVQEIQIKSENGLEGPFFSFELEGNVSKFLDSYVESIRPEPIVSAPVSYRRLGTPTENSYSFFTPSRPLTSEGTTTSFRIDEPQVAKSLPVRAIVLGLLALSLLFFRGIFSSHLSAWILATPTTTVQAPSRVIVPTTSRINSENEFVTFVEGPVEKIEWSGQADRLEVKIAFRNEIAPEKISVTKMNFDEHPRALVKVLEVTGPVDTKNIMVGHSLINQIRMGLHDENGQQNLHLVMDMTSPNVAIASTQQNGKNLNVRLEYGAK